MTPYKLPEEYEEKGGLFGGQRRERETFKD